MSLPSFDQSWTLFLDRDGVINRRLPGRYVTNPDDFNYLPNSLASIVELKKIFGRIVIVTNQKGVGKGLMSQADLDLVHQKMIKDLKQKGGEVDAIYTATDAVLTANSHHKPNPSMGLQAKADFPVINFKKSVIVGDSISDMEFGFGLGMWTVLVAGKEEEKAAAALIEVDESVESLATWTKKLGLENS